MGPIISRIKNFKQTGLKTVSVSLIFALLLLVTYHRVAHAGALTALSDTMSRLDDAVASNHEIKFRVATAVNGSSDTITITFPAGFTIGSTDYTDIDLDHSVDTGYGTSETLAATPAAGVWGAAFSSQVLTLTAPTDAGGSEIAANEYVRVRIGLNASGGDQQITNPSNGTYTIDIGGTFGDSGKIAVAILTNDQVVVSTTVDPYLTFTLSQNTVSLTRSGGASNPDYNNTGFNNGTANTLAANTNGASGYTISYYGDTLKYSTHSIDAMASAGASSTGTEQFGLNLKDNTTPNTGANPSGGSGAPATDYNTADQYRFIANTTTTLASASAPSVTTTFTVSYIVNVSQTTEAGNYSTTLTYICTGNF